MVLPETRRSPVRGAAQPAAGAAAVHVRRILCPVDFSDPSAGAVEQAAALARACGAEMNAVFVLPAAEHEAGEDVLRAANRDVEMFLRRARAVGVPVRVSLRSGDPGSQILAAAGEGPADMIVMATEARPAPAPRLGSVADTVLRNARCPVLTVRSPRPCPRPPSQEPAGGILCAVDLGSLTGSAADHAVFVGRMTGRPVTLLHVLEDLPQCEAAAKLARLDWPAWRDGLLEDARIRLRAAAAAAGAQCGTEAVGGGKAYREILQRANETAAALIVIGAHGADPLHEGFLGSNAEHVVRAAACPVMTVHGA